MRSYRSGLAVPLVNVAFLVMLWVSCGLAAAGIWNAAMYAHFHNCGRQGVEDRAWFLIKGVLGGPLALAVALLDSNFGQNGWSLSAHECAQPIKQDFFGMPS